MQLPFENSFDHVNGQEKAELLLHANNWSTHLTNKLKAKRQIQVFGENIEGKSVLLCRYLRKQKPPV